VPFVVQSPFVFVTPLLLCDRYLRNLSYLQDQKALPRNGSIRPK
jgi:hypothetical protein